MTTVQINPFKTSPSRSTTDSPSFRFNVKMLSRSAPTGETKIFFHPLPNTLLATLLLIALTNMLLQYMPFSRRGKVSLLSRNTNKMQLCNIIYYSKVYWRLNMFRAAHRSSSGALNCICSLWFIYICGDRPLPRLCGNDRSPHVYINQRLPIQFRAPDDERCAARNMLSLQ
jgi:hypothetical protein